MSMTVQDLYDYVRSFLDTDDEDLPDALLAVWLEEATARVQRTFEPWSFYEASWSVTTSGASVAFSNIGTADSVVDSIKSVEGDTWLLKYVPHTTALSKYAWSDNGGATPYEFSVYASTLFIWPTPTASTTFTVRGIRKPNAPATPSDEPDLPPEFHTLLGEWMLGRAYERQDDIEMAASKLGGFREGLDAYRRRYTRPVNAGVQILGGTCDTSAPLERLAYDWER